MTGVELDGVIMPDFRTLLHLHDEELEGLEDDDVVLAIYTELYDGAHTPFCEFTKGELLGAEVNSKQAMVTGEYEVALLGHHYISLTV